MEFLEGETLERRLEKGALPPEQTIRYGAQIANALAKAHKLGITHRDLKPANVMLTKAGAKLLDFGPCRAVRSRTSPGCPQMTQLVASRPQSALRVIRLECLWHCPQTNMVPHGIRLRPRVSAMKITNWEILMAAVKRSPTVRPH